MTPQSEAQLSIPLGVVIRRSPGVTRWVAHVWKAVAVLPGAGDADWKELRREGEVVEYHAGTLMLDLYRTDTEAYRHGLSAREPCVYVVLRDCPGSDALELVTVTASPYEAQDYADTDEELVEKVPMPEGLAAMIRDFVTEHHEEEVFVKRKRDRKRVDLVEDGVGDARIRQLTDVYRAPRPGRRSAS